MERHAFYCIPGAARCLPYQGLQRLFRIPRAPPSGVQQLIRLPRPPRGSLVRTFGAGERLTGSFESLANRLDCTRGFLSFALRARRFQYAKTRVLLRLAHAF